MYAAVGNKRRQRAAGDLAAHRVERRKHDGIRRIVQQQRHARCGLERAHVASVASDDAPLHLLVRQRHRSRRKLAKVRHGAPLDCIRHETAGDGIALFARGFLYAARENRRVGTEFRVRMREDFATRLLVRHLREVAQTLVGGGEIGRGLLLGGGNGGLLRLHCG